MMRRSPAAQPEPFIRPSQTPDPAHQTRTLMHRPSGRQAPAAKAESSAAIRSMKWYAGRTVPPNPQPPLQGKQSSPGRTERINAGRSCGQRNRSVHERADAIAEKLMFPHFLIQANTPSFTLEWMPMLTHPPFVYSKEPSPRPSPAGVLLSVSAMHPKPELPPNPVL